jgi:hypothetical protein
MAEDAPPPPPGVGGGGGGVFFWHGVLGLVPRAYGASRSRWQGQRQVRRGRWSFFRTCGSCARCRGSLLASRRVQGERGPTSLRLGNGNAHRAPSVTRGDGGGGGGGGCGKVMRSVVATLLCRRGGGGESTLKRGAFSFLSPRCSQLWSGHFHFGWRKESCNYFKNLSFFWT